MKFITTAREAEESAAETMRVLGFRDAHVTDVGPDAGIDIVSASAVAQVKWKGAVVGRPDLQRLVGARGRKNHLALFFFAASGFSQAAVDYADDLEIALFVYDPSGTPTAQNRLAHKIVQTYLIAGDTTEPADAEKSVPPVAPTAEESAAEIVAIISELSIEKFNSLNNEQLIEVCRSYRSAIVITENLREKFNNRALAENFEEMRRIAKYGRPEDPYDWTVKTPTAVSGTGPSYSSEKYKAIVPRSSRDNPFGKYVGSVYQPISPEQRINCSVETPLNPIYLTHFNGMPFKYDSKRTCFAYDENRGTYQTFDPETRTFLVPYDREQAAAERAAEGEASRMRKSAERLRYL